MIDWHSHILPAMDDGSESVEESLKMLESLSQQGVDVVAATPHFIADEESVDEFLQRRRAAHEKLLASAVGSVRIICGAEVKYYPGISRMEDLSRLALEGTNILLLEMPMARWTDFTVNELTELANTRGLKIVLAHIERYIAMQNGRVLEELLESGVLMQVNSSFFLRFASKRKAVRMLGAGYIHFIGSDCHNMTSRQPKIEPAYQFISKKLGDDFTSRMIEYGYRFLGKS